MKTEELYLQDIVEACNSIEMFVAGLPKDAFLQTDLVVSAVTKKFEIIGEASARLSPELRDEHPEIDWSSLIGFRNILIHQYFSTNLEIVWEAATFRVEQLREHIQAILRFRFPTESNE